VHTDNNEMQLQVQHANRAERVIEIGGSCRWCFLRIRNAGSLLFCPTAGPLGPFSGSNLSFSMDLSASRSGVSGLDL
jgi:hypothetical protein